MTPKQKALELYHRYHTLGSDFTRGVSMHEFAKQCALIAVDEMINNIDTSQLYLLDIMYWQQVKNEIEQL
jgi:hypothetical protein